ncbi:MAG: D-2-hydroxyacid dehydrogenase [Verrucomicrobia bacterium]|nr:D-2-hydroxyacid dehydrogenase [Verrucomicrobiota bacterium]
MSTATLPFKLPTFVLGLTLGCLFAPATVQGQQIKVLVTANFAKSLQPLADRFPNLHLVAFRSGEDLLREVSDTDAIIGFSASHPTAKILAAGKKLRWLQTGSAGVEDVLKDSTLKNSPVILTNGKIIQGPEIADHALALLLNHTRDLKFYNEQMTQVGFQRKNRLPQIELRGKTVLIVGLGGIGTQVAERCFAFGMRVLAVDAKDIPLTRAVEEVRKPDELDILLPEADVVISCVPHTPESQRMIGAKQFGLMKNGVYIINVSRGPVIDTEALTAALKSGKVRAAGLDVTEPEPLPKDHPLWSMPNVTITPHIATASDQVEARRTKLYRENLERFLTGRPLRNVVDKQKGY